VSRVLVEPSGLVLEVRDGETIYAAAVRQGLRWPTVCKGSAICNRCVVAVVEGDLSPMRAQEREGLERVRWRAGPVPGERLACQAVPVGDVVVHKEGV
jgi:ferredoxin, 2Fe-2S